MEVVAAIGIRNTTKKVDEVKTAEEVTEEATPTGEAKESTS
jgi:hypothetical protein